MIRSTYFLTIIIFAVTLISCSDTSKNQTNTVILTSPKTAAAIPTIIADKKGFFKKNGVDVNINYVKTGKIALDDLIGGKADFANIVETNIAYSGFIGPDIKVLGTIEKFYDAAIVCRKDKNIKSPEDLKGKKIGVLLATTSQVFADRFFEKYNISKENVTIANLLPPAMQSAIIEGSGVDAVSIWQPYIFNIEKALGENSITFQEKDIFTGYMNLAGKSDLIKSRPDIAQKLLKSYIETEDFIKDNKAETISILTEVLGMDEVVLKAIWDQYSFTTSLSKELLNDTKREAAWIIETQPSHKGKSIPEYESFFEPKILLGIDESKVLWTD